MMRAMRFATDHYLVVPLGAIAAVIWANTAPEGYFGFAQSLSFVVNEIGMALFVALIAQELLEAVMPGGALHTWQRAMLPIIAAIGGGIVAVLVYVLYLELVGEMMLEQSWPAACAVDVAFSYFLARIVFRERAPVAFTLMLATASNVMILPFVAMRFPLVEAHASGLVLIAAAVILALALRKSGVRSFWPYVLLCGPMAWFGCYRSGLQPALSPLLVVPFLLHTPRDLSLFEDPTSGPHHSGTHLEHVLTYPVQVVLFFFALVNSGVIVHYFEAGTWALPVSAVVGRTLGVMIAVQFAVAFGFLSPFRDGWREILVVGLIVSTGFSFALFVAASILPIGALLSQTKVGALSTVLGSTLALIFAYAFRIGRFAHWRRR
jgi:NhaA family Na+:H+ antiporter